MVSIIMDMDNILARWYEYIGDLYKDDRGDMPENCRSSHQSQIEKWNKLYGEC